MRIRCGAFRWPAVLVTSTLVSPTAFPEDDPELDLTEVEEEFEEEARQALEEAQEAIEEAIAEAEESAKEAIEEAREAEEEAREAAEEAREEAREAEEEAREAEEETREAEEEAREIGREEEEEEEEEEDVIFVDGPDGRFELRIDDGGEGEFDVRAGKAPRKVILKDKMRLKEDKLVDKRVLRRQAPKPLPAPARALPFDRGAIGEIRRDLEDIGKRLDRIESLIRELGRARETSRGDRPLRIERRIEAPGPARGARALRLERRSEVPGPARGERALRLERRIEAPAPVRVERRVIRRFEPGPEPERRPVPFGFERRV